MFDSKWDLSEDDSTIRDEQGSNADNSDEGALNDDNDNDNDNNDNDFFFIFSSYFCK